MDENVKSFNLACQNGDIETINALFDSVSDTFDMVTAICDAAQNGDLAVVQCLHSNKVNINELSSYGSTPLIEASMHGHVDVVDYIIGQNIDVNVTGWDKWTALMHASCMGKVDIVDRLLAVPGYNINHKSDYGCTALSVAVRNRHHAIVDRLLVNGANYYCNTNFFGANLLHEAVKSKDEVMVRHILTLGLDINHQDYNGDTALILAAQLGYIEIVKILLENGADKAIKGQFGKTAKCHAKTSEIYDYLWRWCPV